jgi:hypothetical protein
MNTDKKVFEKLFSNEKVELASQKYEFAKKAPQILSEATKIENILVKAGLKMNDMKMSYIKTYQELQSAIDQTTKMAEVSEQDLIDIMDSLQAIGMDPKEANNITGFTKAADLVTKIKNTGVSYRKMFRQL